MARRAEVEERRQEHALGHFQADLAAELSANYAGFRAWDAGIDRAPEENWAVRAAGWYRLPAAAATRKRVAGVSLNGNLRNDFLSCLIRRLERNYATFFSWANF